MKQPKTADMCTVVPLSALSIDPANVRKTDTDPSREFVANILAEGIEVPLLCRPGKKNGDVRTFDGGKRLRALWQIKEEMGTIKGVPVTASYSVPIILHDINDTEARAKSLSLAIHRDDLHPIDRFEAFAELVAAGETPESIALIHGMDAKKVNQALALGGLSEKVRIEWRTGGINARTAQAFTMAKDHKIQDQIFDKLKKKRELTDFHVKRELNVADDEIGALLNFVGEDAYTAAGGQATRDLFSDTTAIVSEPIVLRKLAEDKLAAECERLVSVEGWGWAIVKPEHHFYGVRDQVKPKFTEEQAARVKVIEARLEALRNEDDPMGGTVDEDDEWEALDRELREITTAAEIAGASPKFRKAHGCTVHVNEEGRLHITYGYKELPKGNSSQPSLSGAAADAVGTQRQRQAAKKASGGAGAVSNALNQRLSEQLTDAAALVMRDSPQVAFAALVAGALSREKFVDIKVQGLRDKQRNSYSAVSFVTSFEAMMKAKPDEVAREIAGIVARALDFQEFNADSPPLRRKPTAAVCNALEPKAMAKAIARHWDAADYFSSVSGPIRKMAVTEALGEVPAVVAKMKKDQQAKWCATNVPPTGWLPPQLRTEHYSGPSKGGSKKPVAKKKPTKKAKRK